mmetsp:Transcript_668/g.1522  ORF Transcript_668/g.1522 Transcript_668/m.1522 type:complete len:316 (+) Transcript_668:171-1118(+)
MTAPISSHCGTCPCALPGFPPPLPPTESNTSFSHSFAINPFSSLSASGTTAKQSTFPPLPGSSSDTPMNAISGASFCTALMTFCDALESAPMSRSRTNALLPSARARSTSTATPFRHLSTLPAKSRFLASMPFFWMDSMRARSSDLRAAESSAASRSLRRAPACLSRSGVSSALMDSRVVVLPSNSIPSSMAFLAASLVSAVILLTPLATAVSSVRTKASASAVFDTCVPPQNSTEVSSPMVTTRTGSGYTSPNTARTPGIFLASSSGTTRAETGRAPSTTSRTYASTSLNCAAVTAFLCPKSNRSFSSLAWLPR